jgi:hypothetical protein
MMENGKKSNKKAIIAVIALVVIIAAFIGVYFATKKAPVEGEKTITVSVVDKDGASEEFTYQTDREFLGEVLQDEKLVEGEAGEFGLFITSVNGITADESNQEWWCITKTGEQVNTSADQTPIADGESYELTLKVGY